MNLGLGILGNMERRDEEREQQRQQEEQQEQAQRDWAYQNATAANERGRDLARQGDWEGAAAAFRSSLSYQEDSNVRDNLNLADRRVQEEAERQAREEAARQAKIVDDAKRQNTVSPYENNTADNSDNPFATADAGGGDDTGNPNCWPQSTTHQAGCWDTGGGRDTTSNETMGEDKKAALRSKLQAKLQAKLAEGDKKDTPVADDMSTPRPAAGDGEANPFAAAQESYGSPSDGGRDTHPRIQVATGAKPLSVHQCEAKHGAIVASQDGDGAVCRLSEGNYLPVKLPEALENIAAVPDFDTGRKKHH